MAALVVRWWIFFYKRTTEELQQEHKFPRQLVPFAVRWYTGEAFPDDGESEDEEDEDEEDPEEEDDDDEIETGEGGKKKDIFKSGGEKPDLGGKQGNTEECKQQ